MVSHMSHSCCSFFLIFICLGSKDLFLSYKVLLDTVYRWNCWIYFAFHSMNSSVSEIFFLYLALWEVSHSYPKWFFWFLCIIFLISVFSCISLSFFNLFWIIILNSFSEISHISSLESVARKLPCSFGSVVFPSSCFLNPYFGICTSALTVTSSNFLNLPS